MKTTIEILLAVSVILYVSACSKLNTDVPSAPNVTTHKDGIINQASTNFHGNLIRLNSWDMETCRQCHASNYSGGIAKVSCLTCHTNPGGPEACNTCHGDFNDIGRIAPPRDIDKDTLTTSPGVGAHVQHLYDNNFGSPIPCSTCHNVPQNVYDAGHVDSNLPAEVIFGNLAIHNGANASYNFSNATCSDVYCHGNFQFLKDSSANQFAYTSDKMMGNNQSVIFNQVNGTQAACGTCHNLPPEGHIAATLDACGGCHSGIVNSNGEIVDSLSYKHINGMKNVFGN